MNFLLVFFYLVLPAVILYLCKKFSFLDKFGAVGIAYIVGLLLGNIGILGVTAKPVQDNLSAITVLLALPLLLMSINLKQWTRLAGKTVLSMVLGILAIIISVIAGHLMFHPHITECWKVSGMLTGVYLGATFNMAAIKMALNANDEVFGILNAYDIIICMFYFFFIITIAQKLLNKILPAFKFSENYQHNIQQSHHHFDGWDSYKGIFTKPVLFPLIFAIAIAILIAVGSLFISKQFPGSIYSTAIIILSATTLSIIVSLMPYLNSIKKTFQGGMYLILVFCVVVGSMADISLFSTMSIYLLYYVSFVIFGSLSLHIIFAWIFKIDTDTLLISSSAMIFSPPFVPAIANALNNKEIILSGLTVGIVGYSVGNYIGIALAHLLR